MVSPPSFKSLPFSDRILSRNDSKSKNPSNSRFKPQPCNTPSFLSSPNRDLINHILYPSSSGPTAVYDIDIWSWVFHGIVTKFHAENAVKRSRWGDCAMFKLKCNQEWPLHPPVWTGMVKLYMLLLYLYCSTLYQCIVYAVRRAYTYFRGMRQTCMSRQHR